MEIFNFYTVTDVNSKGEEYQKLLAQNVLTTKKHACVDYKVEEKDDYVAGQLVSSYVLKEDYTPKRNVVGADGTEYKEGEEIPAGTVMKYKTPRVMPLKEKQYNAILQMELHQAKLASMKE
jgi:hypothetical protein